MSAITGVYIKIWQHLVTFCYTLLKKEEGRSYDKLRKRIHTKSYACASLPHSKDYWQTARTERTKRKNKQSVASRMVRKLSVRHKFIKVIPFSKNFAANRRRKGLRWSALRADECPRSALMSVNGGDASRRSWARLKLVKYHLYSEYLRGKRWSRGFFNDDNTARLR